jgi:DNA-nicking Smr family endonuclease
MIGTITIDLHGLRAEEARAALLRAIDSAPMSVHTLQVVHGIGTGALKDLVKEFYHSRIVSRAQVIGNAGQTNLYLG